jgi:hypothetical protein
VHLRHADVVVAPHARIEAVFECPVCERTEYTTVELENYRLKTRRSPDLAAETSPCVGGGKGLIPTYPIALALLGHGL